MTATFMASLKEEAEWLRRHPEFIERPATILQFIGPDYLNIHTMVRPALKEVLVDIFGDEPNPAKVAKYRQAIFTGGIGTGKSTLASIALVYMVHWLLCLRDPQGFLGLLPGSRIAAMMMSTSSSQARQVVFGDIKARVVNSPWFKKHPYDKSFRNQIRFPKDIWIIPGDSAETTFEGYNIYFGILEEIDSHKVTKEKDYAEQGYTTIQNRVSSRFGDRGFIFCIGQMKSEGGFAMRHYEEFAADPESYATKMTLWESLGWHKFVLPDGTRDSFFYDTRRKMILSKETGEFNGGEGVEGLIEVPQVYRRDFESDPMKALRDLAGIPPSVEDPFIIQDYKIEDARERWQKWAVNKLHTLGEEPPSIAHKLEQWVRCDDAIPRFAHVDIGVTTDALGLALAHSPGRITVEGEEKSLVIVDLAMRITAVPGGAIELSMVRQVLKDLRDRRKYRIKLVTFDTYQSTDMIQQLRKMHFNSDVLSVDKDVTPYYDLREALYDLRLALPPSHEEPVRGQKAIDILRFEMVNLQDLGNKIDHPEGGSKDVADAVAGAVYNVMNFTRSRSQMPILGDPPALTANPQNIGSGAVGSVRPVHHAVRAASGGIATVPWRGPGARGG